MNIREIAKKATQISDLTIDREKISTEDIIKYYKGRIHITDIDEVQTGEDRYYIYLMSEEPKKYALTGYVLSKIFDSIMQEYEGDITAINADLHKEPLEVRLYADKTKAGRQMTNVEVL